MKSLNDGVMLKDTISVTLLLVFSSILGFVSQIILVSTFGASVEMDVYFKLLAVPTVITGIVPMIFSSVLIPHFAKLKSDQTKLIKFIESLAMFVVIVAFAFSVFGFLAFFFNMRLFIPKSHAYLEEIGRQVSFMIWIGSGFSIISSLLATILNYNKQFSKVVWTSILPPFFVIIIVLLFHGELGIRSISLGFCLAFMLQFIIFIRASKITLNFSYFDHNHIGEKTYLIKQSFLVLISLLPFTVLAPIAYYCASPLEEGSISYLGYSQSFAGFLSVAVGMGISIVSFPDLADTHAAGSGEAVLLKFEQRLRYVLLIAMFAAGAFITLKVPIITLFYQRGSFRPESVVKLASVLPWYLVAAVFTAALNLLRTLFYSRGEFRFIAILGITTPILFFGLAWVMKNNLSFVGIGIANTITFGALFCASVVLLKKKTVGFLANDFLLFTLSGACITLISGFITTLSMKATALIDNQIFLIGINALMFLTVYFLCAKFVFRLKEVNKLGLFFAKNKNLSKR